MTSVSSCNEFFLLVYKHALPSQTNVNDKDTCRLHLPLSTSPFLCSFIEKLTESVLPSFSFPPTPASLPDFSWLLSYRSSEAAFVKVVITLYCQIQWAFAIWTQPSSGFGHGCLCLPDTLCSLGLYDTDTGYFSTPVASILKLLFCLDFSFILFFWNGPQYL